MVEKTRNQVVAQAARGFESHPVRQRKTGESNGFIRLSKDFLPDAAALPQVFPPAGALFSR